MTFHTLLQARFSKWNKRLPIALGDAEADYPHVTLSTDHCLVHLNTVELRPELAVRSYV